VERAILSWLREETIHSMFREGKHIKNCYVGWIEVIAKKGIKREM
jgi:hypothetical protein